MKADSDVTADDMTHFNLILLGSMRDNLLFARMSIGLPFKITHKNELLAGGREPISQDGAELRVLYYNPRIPKRLIFILATDEQSVSVDDWLKVSWDQNPMTGANGMNPGDQPDLVVRTIGGPVRRQMQFTRGWQWRKVPGSDVRLPRAMASQRELNKAELRVMQRNTGADFALTWGSKADDMRFDPVCTTLADVAIESAPRQVLLAKMTGDELVDVYEKWPSEDDVVVFPGYDANGIDLQRDYDVALPPSFCWKLTARQKNLRNVQAGPDWDVAELWEEVFQSQPK